jgi:hypothetical protein
MVNSNKSFINLDNYESCNLKVNDELDKTGTDPDIVLPERCNSILL